MGTRGFLGFVIDGTEKIAYNHFDSYPGGLGWDVLSWLLSADLAEAKTKAAALKVIDPESEPSDEDIERAKSTTNLNVGGPSDRPTWYQLLRETQGNPGLILEAGALEDAGEFPQDSLFAEWGYIIDFDTQVFEVYQGFQHSRPTAGRFADRPLLPRREDYFPCALKASWPLGSLPDKAAFMAATEDAEDDA